LLKYSTWEAASREAPETILAAAATSPAQCWPGLSPATPQQYQGAYALPGDALSFVLLLLLFQDESDEELLQFLVAIVDAELFEAGGDGPSEELSLPGGEWG
jgi:hypothetical protein